MDVIIGLAVLLSYPYAMWILMYRAVIGNWRFWENDL